jgi:hypothetical protein
MKILFELIFINWKIVFLEFGSEEAAETSVLVVASTAEEPHFNVTD